MEPKAGEMVIFPPWLVHSVPPGPKSEGKSAAGDNGEVVEEKMTHEDELLRVSFSFNLLGRWEHTARTSTLVA